MVQGILSALCLGLHQLVLDSRQLLPKGASDPGYRFVVLLLLSMLLPMLDLLTQVAQPVDGVMRFRQLLPDAVA